MNIFIASANKHKIEEFKEMLEPLGYEISSLNDLDEDIEIEENGHSFEENALIKARYIAKKFGIIAISDDSGLEIDALNKQPGIYSARFLGHDTSYDIKNAAILEKMKDVPEERRGAEFVCSICAILPDGKAVFAEGSLRGRVAHEIRGKEGFGYDPIFYLPQYGKTTAELGNDFKNSVSHRSQALHKMEELIRNMSQEMDRT